MRRRHLAVLAAACAVVSLAVLPAMAQASITLKTSGGTLAKGAGITLRPDSISFIFDGSATECEAELEGTLKQNPAPEVELSKEIWWGSYEHLCPYFNSEFATMAEITSLPTTVSLTEEGGSGVVKFPGLEMSMTLYRKFEGTWSPTRVCDFKGDATGHYGFGSQMELSLSGELAKVSGASACGTILPFETNAPFTLKAGGQTIRAARSGLFRNGGASSLLAGEELLISSKNPSFKMAWKNEKPQEARCTLATITAKVTQPGSEPAVATTTGSHFTWVGEYPENRCEWNGEEEEITTNTPEGLSLDFNAEGGQLSGPVLVTSSDYMFGTWLIYSCTYEVEKIGTSYISGKPLGLKFEPVSLKLIPAQFWACSATAELNLGEATVTDASAGGQAVEVLAG